MNKLYKILSSTLLISLAYCFYKWYILVYKTKLDFVKEGTKPIEAIFYEELFFKVILFLGISCIVLISINFLKTKSRSVK